MKLGQNSPCGGVLVSEQKVVTGKLKVTFNTKIEIYLIIAGKCMYRYDPINEKIEKFPLMNLLVVLGSHNIYDKNEVDRKPFPISSFHIHEEYDFLAEKMDADIAVLVLKKIVEFTKFIQPICMMDLGPDLNAISEGVVVSYGHSETEKRLPTLDPKKIVSKIYENDICPSKNGGFESISSNRTFCGGDSKGTGVCNEDIGSGLFVKHDDHFYLRGIVSVVVGGNEGGCDDSTYSLFTDTSKFIKWIDAIPDDSESSKVNWYDFYFIHCEF